MLIGDGEYNLDNLKEIKGTDSYLGLDLDTRDCQNDKPFYNCTTQHYMEGLLRQCGCLPLNLRFSAEVGNDCKNYSSHCYYHLRVLFAPPQMNLNVSVPLRLTHPIALNPALVSLLQVSLNLK